MWKKRLSKIPAGTFTIFTVLAILWLTLAPKPLGEKPPSLFEGADKLAHAVMFGGLAIIILFDRQRKHNWKTIPWPIVLLAASVSSIIGILIEIIQDRMGLGRGFETGDIIADVSGAFIFSLIWLFLQNFWIERGNN